MNLWITNWQAFLQNHPSLDVVPHRDYPTVPGLSPAALAREEYFWERVRAQFPQHPGLINLNSGAVSAGPHAVEKAFVAYYQLMNQLPSYYAFKYMEGGRELIREGLAGLLNAEAGEVAMLRNTTEALNNVIFGVPLRAGDEVVACKQDYSKGVSSWKQRALRENITLRWVNLEGSQKAGH
jgi:selenocysteine lyase/cysteine desulfurase